MAYGHKYVILLYTALCFEGALLLFLLKKWNYAVFSHDLRATPYLCDASVCPLETSLDTLRRLIGELDGGLQQVDGELGVHLRGNPQPELVVAHLRSRNLQAKKKSV